MSVSARSLYRWYPEGMSVGFGPGIYSSISRKTSRKIAAVIGHVTGHGMIRVTASGIHGEMVAVSGRLMSRPVREVIERVKRETLCQVAGSAAA